MNRRYVKQGPSLDAFEKKHEDSKPKLLQIHGKTQNSITEYAIAKDYVKKEGEVIPKTFVVVFSGGEVREKDYFAPLLQHRSFFPGIKLEFQAEDRFLEDGKPRLFSYAVDKVDRYKTSTPEETPDYFYVVSDVDHFGQYLKPFLVECEKVGINLIVSNPCFEVWLYYSRRDDHFDGFILPSDSLKISQCVKTFVNKRIPGGINPKWAMHNIDQNIKNSEKNYEVEGSVPKLFSTNMHLLAKVLHPLVKDGLAKMLRLREEKKKMFINK